MPCSIASRSWSKAAISLSSRPNVCRFSRRDSASAASTPTASTPSKYSASDGSAPLSCLETAVSAKPTETSPISFPPSHTGTLPTASQPSEPCWMPVHATPVRNGSVDSGSASG